jgi:anti-sigma regulatory factor (Ser/Thr protein kinase)
VGAGRRPDNQNRQIIAVFGMRFGMDDLRRVRQEAARWSRQIAMPSERAVDFVIAVNEVATNAVRHGSPAASLMLRVILGNMAEAEIRDSGTWLAHPEPEHGAAPFGDAEHGRMGLELVRKVCDALEIRTGRDGTTVLLRMNLQAPGHQPG